jgi:hypothetical protein
MFVFRKDGILLFFSISPQIQWIVYCEVEQTILFLSGKGHL